MPICCFCESDRSGFKKLIQESGLRELDTCSGIAHISCDRRNAQRCASATIHRGIQSGSHRIRVTPSVMPITGPNTSNLLHMHTLVCRFSRLIFLNETVFATRTQGARRPPSCSTVPWTRPGPQCEYGGRRACGLHFSSGDGSGPSNQRRVRT